MAVLSEQRGPLQLGAHGHGVTVIGAPSSAVSLLLPIRRPPPPLYSYPARGAAAARPGVFTRSLTTTHGSSLQYTNITAILSTKVSTYYSMVQCFNFHLFQKVCLPLCLLVTVHVTAHILPFTCKPGYVSGWTLHWACSRLPTGHHVGDTETYLHLNTITS